MTKICVVDFSPTYNDGKELGTNTVSEVTRIYACFAKADLLATDLTLFSAGDGSNNDELENR